MGRDCESLFHEDQVGGGREGGRAEDWLFCSLINSVNQQCEVLLCTIFQGSVSSSNSHGKTSGTTASPSKGFAWPMPVTRSKSFASGPHQRASVGRPGKRGISDVGARKLDLQRDGHVELALVVAERHRRERGRRRGGDAHSCSERPEELSCAREGLKCCPRSARPPRASPRPARSLRPLVVLPRVQSTRVHPHRTW